jgi:aspartyl-tRNA(Asn)/glutamyl-tRNA(Gln) amidotransferase subunit C
MSKLTRDDVLRLAALSRLKLSEAEIAKFQEELSQILDYVEQLEGVDINGLEPTYQLTGLKNIMRADKEIDYGYTSDELLKNAPATQNKQFKVKRVL